MDAGCRPTEDSKKEKEKEKEKKENSNFRDSIIDKRLL
jgi:hypothetical protein